MFREKEKMLVTSIFVLLLIFALSKTTFLSFVPTKVALIYKSRNICIRVTGEMHRSMIQKNYAKHTVYPKDCIPCALILMFRACSFAC